MVFVEILVVIPLHELLVKQLGCLSCEPGRQDFGQISGIICSILPKDPNQEPCSPVRKVSEIQPCPFRIVFSGGEAQSICDIPWDHRIKDWAEAVL